ALSLLPESWGPLVVNLNGMKDSWSLEWIRAQVLQEEFRRKELTAAAGEGGGFAYGMKGFKGRSSKKGKAKEGSGGEQYSGGKRSNKGGKRCGGKCWYCHVEGHPWFKCRKLPDGWRPGLPSIEGSKGVHGAMGEGMGSEEGRAYDEGRSRKEPERKELTAAAGEGGGSAYGMKGFKGRGSKKGKAKEGSGGKQYSGGKRSNKGGKRCGGKCWYCHVEGHPWFKCRKLPDGWRPGLPSIEGSKGVHGAMGEGMGSEEGDGGAGGHGGM
ncbi:unnamed protein product, partial [Closterium sp. NIES-53]